MTEERYTRASATINRCLLLTLVLLGAQAIITVFTVIRAFL